MRRGAPDQKDPSRAGIARPSATTGSTSASPKARRGARHQTGATGVDVGGNDDAVPHQLRDRGGLAAGRGGDVGDPVSGTGANAVTTA